MALQDIIQLVRQSGGAITRWPEIFQLAMDLDDHEAMNQALDQWLVFHRCVKCPLVWPHTDTRCEYQEAAPGVADVQQAVQHSGPDWCAHSHPHEGDCTTVHTSTCRCLTDLGVNLEVPEGMTVFAGTDQDATHYLAQLLGDGQQSADAFWEAVSQRIKDGKESVVELPNISISRGGIQYLTPGQPVPWDRYRADILAAKNTAKRVAGDLEKRNRRLKKRLKRLAEIHEILASNYDRTLKERDDWKRDATEQADRVGELERQLDGAAARIRELLAEKSRPSARTDLDAIRARAEAATPGPWAYLQNDDIRSQANTDRIMMSDVDMEFMTHAREDIPALLARVDELTAERDQARAELAEERPRDDEQRYSNELVELVAEAIFRYDIAVEPPLVTFPGPGVEHRGEARAALDALMAAGWLRDRVHVRHSRDAEVAELKAKLEVAWAQIDEDGVARLAAHAEVAELRAEVDRLKASPRITVIDVAAQEEADHACGQGGD